jgi:hypothetical protein
MFCRFLNPVFTVFENYTEKAIVCGVTGNIQIPTHVTYLLFTFARLFALQRERERFDNESNSKPAIKFSKKHVINNHAILYAIEQNKVLNFYLLSLNSATVCSTVTVRHIVNFERWH